MAEQIKLEEILIESLKGFAYNHRIAANDRERESTDTYAIQMIYGMCDDVSMLNKYMDAYKEMKLKKYESEELP